MTEVNMVNSIDYVAKLPHQHQGMTSGGPWVVPNSNNSILNHSYRPRESWGIMTDL